MKSPMDIKLSEFEITLIMAFIGALIRIAHDREKQIISFYRIFFILISATGLSYALFILGKKYTLGDMTYVYTVLVSVFISDVISLVINKIPSILNPSLELIGEQIKNRIKKIFS